MLIRVRQVLQFFKNKKQYISLNEIDGNYVETDFIFAAEYLNTSWILFILAALLTISISEDIPQNSTGSVQPHHPNLSSHNLISKYTHKQGKKEL